MVTNIQNLEHYIRTKYEQQKQCSIFQVSHNVTLKIGKGLRLTLNHSLEVHFTIQWNLV